MYDTERDLRVSIKAESIIETDEGGGMRWGYEGWGYEGWGYERWGYERWGMKLRGKGDNGL